MPIFNLEVPESSINDTIDELFTELTVESNVSINDNKVTVYDLLEDMMCEDKDDVFAMLLVDPTEARAHAEELIWARFLSEYDDEAIEKHYINEMESY
tara:strand:+ start:318 stop:611 length:294 start_codon:yes stop_codon:yes gene_type:complete